MHGINDNALASVVAFVAVGVTTFWLALVGTAWKAFFEPQVKQLRADRDADQRRCDMEIRELKGRIAQLETMFLMHAPQHLRQQMQGVISEIRVDAKDLQK